MQWLDSLAEKELNELKLVHLELSLIKRIENDKETNENESIEEEWEPEEEEWIEEEWEPEEEEWIEEEWEEEWEE